MTMQDTMEATTEERAIEPPAPTEFPVALQARGGPASQHAIPLDGMGKLLVGDDSIQLVTRATRKGPHMAMGLCVFVALFPWLVPSMQDGSTSHLVDSFLIAFPLYGLSCALSYGRRTLTINTATQSIMVDPERRRFFFEVEPGRWVYAITGLRSIGPLMELLQTRFKNTVKIQPIPHLLKGSTRQWLACIPSAILMAILAVGVAVGVIVCIELLS